MNKLLLSTVCALALGVGSAMAQSTQPPPPSTGAPMSPAPARPAPAPIAIMAAKPSGSLFVTPSTTSMSTAELIGTKVRNKANESVGDIADVMVDQEGRMQSVILSVGGFLGVGTRYVAVSPTALSISKYDDKSYAAEIDTTKEALKSAPEFKYTRKSS
jgi:hypothetical protein